MSAKMTAAETLDREFLEIRCRLIDIAAALDRIDASQTPEPIAFDPRITAIKEALKILPDGKPDRAARVQLVFSDPYDEHWRQS